VQPFHEFFVFSIVSKAKLSIFRRILQISANCNLADDMVHSFPSEYQNSYFGNDALQLVFFIVRIPSNL
jgi:hypothetical protein